jgi:hypothetical protein
MTSWLSIMEKTSTFLNETIHITPRCTVHLHGHWNKLVSLMKPSIFANLNDDIKFHNEPISTWSERTKFLLLMWWLLIRHRKHIIVLSIQHAHFFKWGHTWHLKWHHVWLSTDFQIGNEVSVCQMRQTHVHTHTWKDKMSRVESNLNKNATLRWK